MDGLSLMAPVTFLCGFLFMVGYIVEQSKKSMERESSKIQALLIEIRDKLDK